MEDEKVFGSIKKLRSYRNSPFLILSVYLGLNQRQTVPRKVVYSQFRSLEHSKLSEDERKMFRKDLEKIANFIIEEYDWRNTRGLAIFTAGKSLWEILEFEFFLKPTLSISHSPNIKPIENAIEAHRKYVVLMADREKARIFSVQLGKILEHEDIFEGEVPQRVKAKKVDWGRYDKIPRHIEDHLHRHLVFISQKTQEFLKRDGKRKFIILGGNDEMIPKMEKHLPSRIRKMVKGRFISELNIPINDIFLRSKLEASKVG